MKKIIILLTSILLLCGCSSATEEPAKPTFVPQQPPSQSLTLEEKVGQLFMVRSDSVTEDSIKTLQPGGVIMFAVDFDGITKEEAKTRIENLKNMTQVKPYIAVDEEGGTVVRVSRNPNLAPEKFESPQYYYNEGGIELVLEKEKQKSELLLDLGINMNLSPVSDVSTKTTTFIYDRTFGKGAEETADYVRQVVGVMDGCGISSSLKHFPGYGDNLDTHVTIAIDNRPLDHFRNVDFLPFISGIDAGADSVMVSHNIITAVDPNLPASLSKPVHDLLRNELAFDGIIITDDMAMAAAEGYKEPYKTAVLAGNDMIIVTDFETAYNEVLNAVRNGEIPEDMINAAVDRIINAKMKRGII